MNEKKKLNINSIKTIALTALIVAASILLFQNFISKETLNNNEIVKEFPQEYKIISPNIPSNLEFCGERVPIDNFEVYERLDREFIVNTYWHSLMILTLKRANRWFPVIEPILKKNNIPDDFKFLCVTESTLLNLISPSNAVGFWQILKGSGQELGLEINDEVDERYSVEKSTEAACKYLRSAYEKFGNWTMAAASYNMGRNGINDQLGRQKTNNYYNLVLNDETSRYVFRIIATKIMMNNPSEYGFDLKPEDLYKPYEMDEVFIDSTVLNWADFAIARGINYKILKLYNPWLRDNFLTNKQKKSYTIKLPKPGTITVIPEL
ncbi:MAG: lytic transglycosylase domain-containing protein [Ignavibacteriae bacterium]|nr:lytic transglycosylase domain-containing protein [Ignavibacteriota bacterium]